MDFFMVMLTRKFILTANIANLAEKPFVDKTKGIVKSHIINSALVPGLTPNGTTTLAKITGLETLYDTRKYLRQQMKQNTKDIHNAETDINDTLLGWMPQVLTAIGRDEAKAKLLGWGIKWVDDGQAEEPVASVTNSKPLISVIDKEVSLQHTIHIINSVSGSWGIPKDAHHTDVYIWIGDDAPPMDLTKLTFLGQAVKGKFVNQFSFQQLGIKVWYVAVYRSKKSLKANELSGAVKATVN